MRKRKVDCNHSCSNFKYHYFSTFDYFSSSEGTEINGKGCSLFLMAWNSIYTSLKMKRLSMHFVFRVLGDFRSLGFMIHFSAVQKICHTLPIAYMRKRGSFNANGNFL